MTRLKVESIDIDENTLYRIAKFRVNNKSITTPSRAIDLSLIKSNINIKNDVRGVNEVYKKLDEKKVNDLMTNTDSQKTFDYSINSSFNKSTPIDLNLLILEYDGRNYPKGKMLEYISDNAHSFSDIVVLPAITNVDKRIGIDKFDEFKTFLKDFIEETEKLNSKPIMGMVPTIAWIFMEDLAEFYIDNGIEAFCFDFNGKSPSSVERNLRPFLKAIRQRGLEEKSLLYAFNANPGKIAKYMGVVPAKDILSFGLGFDILGLKHKVLKGPPELFEKLKKSEKKIRIFNKDDYSFHESGLKTIETIYPSDSSIDPEQFKKAPKTAIDKIAKIVNIEQQGIEALRLRSIIKDNRIANYITSKANMKDSDKKTILNIKSKLK